MHLRELTYVAVVLRIFTAVLIGGVIGVERGMKNRPAGLRTYMVVCLGACLIMMTNQYVYQYFGVGDPVRMGAQVISGIGFLGAGTIVVTRHNQIKGLTTAAGLWAAAGVGLAIGIGFYEGALYSGCTTIFMGMPCKNHRTVITKGERSILKKPLFTGTQGDCHIQGIAVDRKNGHIYYSFTTKLIKATLDGQVLGSVDGLVGHLGCIAFNDADGCVYGSLEYKNDAIGKGIQNAIDSSLTFSDAFYIVKFDAAKIDRLQIPAENSDIMSAVYLKEVAEDYNGVGKDKTGKEVSHRYGCSGIDGITFGPLPGKNENDGIYLYVAYGVYSDVTRDDNDYQVLLCYDFSDWHTYASPLDQQNMHRNGPDAPLHKFFVYTGNTCYGVQNLEYDSFTKAFFMAVYKGRKPDFPNFLLFAADAQTAPKTEKHNATAEMIETLTLSSLGSYDDKSGIYGWDFPFGATGLYSYGDGKWLISHNKSTPAGQCAYIYPYVWDHTHPFQCEIPVSE